MKEAAIAEEARRREEQERRDREMAARLQLGINRVDSLRSSWKVSHKIISAS